MLSERPHHRAACHQTLTEPAINIAAMGKNIKIYQHPGGRQRKNTPFALPLIMESDVAEGLVFYAYLCNTDGVIDTDTILGGNTAASGDGGAATAEAGGSSSFTPEYSTFDTLTVPSKGTFTLKVEAYKNGVKKYSKVTRSFVVS